MNRNTRLALHAASLAALFVQGCRSQDVQFQSQEATVGPLNCDIDVRPVKPLTIGYGVFSSDKEDQVVFEITTLPDDLCGCPCHDGQNAAPQHGSDTHHTHKFELIGKNDKVVVASTQSARVVLKRDLDKRVTITEVDGNKSHDLEVAGVYVMKGIHRAPVVTPLARDKWNVAFNLRGLAIEFKVRLLDHEMNQ